MKISVKTLDSQTKNFTVSDTVRFLSMGNFAKLRSPIRFSSCTDI